MKTVVLVTSDSDKSRRFWDLHPLRLRMTLRSHLIILAAIAIFPIMVSSVVALVIFVRHERTAMEKSAVERVRALSTAVDAELRSSITTLEALATSRQLDGTGNLAMFYADATRALASRPEWLTINLARPSGEQTLNLLRPLASSLPPIAERASFDAVVRAWKPAIGDITRGGLSGAAGVPVRVPVIRDGALRYVLSAIVKPQSMMAVLSGQGIPDDWVVSVLDQSNRHIARTRANDRYLGALPSTDLLLGLATSAEGTYRGQTLEGQRIYAAFSRSQVTGWSVAIGIPAAVLDASVRRASAWMVVGFLVSTALALGIAILNAREIAEPVTRLTQGARAVTRGEPPGLRPTKVVELGELARALDDAAIVIRERDQEREKLLSQAQAARLEAEATNRAKDEFLAMLGHELRNPLGAIASAVRVLDHAGNRRDDDLHARDVIARQTEHLARLVDDLLDLGRLTTGKILLDRQPADLAEIVRRAIGTVRTTRSLEGLSLDVDAKSVWIEADVIRIEQVVVNLLSNAAKFTPAGGRICVTVWQNGSDGLIRVEDSGSGIAADLLPRIFDLFVQGVQPPHRARGGLGIGLTVVRRLVELHGGSVEASSDGPGRGSAFTVRLPAVTAPLPDDARRRTREHAIVPRRVLIVEDNADAREMLKALLMLEGHEVHEATDGPSAVEAIRRERPDIALIDIGLPGLDGYEVARQVRSRPDGQDCLLVALTGYGLGADRKRTREAGFDFHLVKPLRPNELKQVFAQAPTRGRGASRL